MRYRKHPPHYAYDQIFHPLSLHPLVSTSLTLALESKLSVEPTHHEQALGRYRGSLELGFLDKAIVDRGTDFSIGSIAGLGFSGTEVELGWAALDVL